MHQVIQTELVPLDTEVRGQLQSLWRFRQSDQDHSFTSHVGVTE